VDSEPRSITNDGRVNFGHGQGDGEYLIETTAYPRLLHVEELSESARLGRRSLDATVTVIHEGERSHEEGRGLYGLTIGDADLLELSVDRERGVVLRSSSLYQGVTYRVVEITTVDFDQLLSPDTFTIEPELGTEWVST
jgi:hypothetical protein